ncbi:MAG: hypothetical protein NT160_04015 [Actinobacteria bacterium]|nr:hypothetical protein [Actinomycetota bacterium]
MGFIQEASEGLEIAVLKCMCCSMNALTFLNNMQSTFAKGAVAEGSHSFAICTGEWPEQILGLPYFCSALGVGGIKEFSFYAAVYDIKMELWVKGNKAAFHGGKVNE